MPTSAVGPVILGPDDYAEAQSDEVSSQHDIHEKSHVSVNDAELHKDALAPDTEKKAASDGDYPDRNNHADEAIIITGSDVAKYLLPMRDDFEPALTFRSIFLATILSCFQAVVYQIYSWKPTSVTIGGTFIVLIGYFLGKAWSSLLPRGDRLEAQWRARGGQGGPPRWIHIISFFNYGPWNLKEHSICAITATSASNGAAAIQVFAAQKLFYDMPLDAKTVILSTISIGLFGYGISGIMRPIAVWDVDAVYWSSLPTVKTLQGLHWQDLKNSKPLRYFWYAFGSMSVYELLPAYIFPWLNSVSVPCLASMNATGDTGDVLTNLFGGSVNNEGLGLFNLSFDWQYITSFNTSLPLKLQANAAIGYLICYLAMLGIYYNDVWGAKSLPFMLTRLLIGNGDNYPTTKVFVGSVLNEEALSKYSIPRLSGLFAFSLLIVNATISALIAYYILFWGKDITKVYKNVRKGVTEDLYYKHIAKYYKETL